jgi:cytochrome c5
MVTTFRGAQILMIQNDGTLVGTPISLNTRVDTSAAQLAAQGLTGGTPQNFVPEISWRAVVGPAGDLVVSHEGGTDRVIDITDSGSGGTQVKLSTSCSGGGGYGGSVCTTTSGPPICSPPIMVNLVSSVSQAGVVSDGPALPQGALPVDILPSSDGKNYSVALAGNPSGTFGPNILTVPAVSQTAGPLGNQTTFDSDLCGMQFAGNGVTVPGSVVALAMDPGGTVIAQTREPATIQILAAGGTQSVSLSTDSVANQGFDIFHTNTGHGMTCAGCHAEGQDDSRTWNFAQAFTAAGEPNPKEARRTQTFRVGFLDTQPFHWDGEFAGLPALMEDVFVHRMGAVAVPDANAQAALEQWMNAIPPKMHDAPSAALTASIAAGKTVFEESSVGCTTCHSGPNFTNNEDEDIGFPDGSKLQTPTLIDVAFRAPYLHDGSVATLQARFTDVTAMSGKHGHTAQLSALDIDNLIAYLESL